MQSFIAHSGCYYSIQSHYSNTDSSNIWDKIFTSVSCLFNNFYCIYDCLEVVLFFLRKFFNSSNSSWSRFELELIWWHLRLWRYKVLCLQSTNDDDDISRNTKHFPFQLFKHHKLLITRSYFRSFVRLFVSTDNTLSFVACRFVPRRHIRWLSMTDAQKNVTSCNLDGKWK